MKRERMSWQRAMIGEPANLRADAVGVDAARFLKTTAHAVGRTIAVFDHVFYAEFADQILCVTRPSVDLGPISLRTSARQAWPKYAIHPHQIVTLNARNLVVAGKLQVNLTLAKEAKPAPPKSQAARPLSKIDLGQFSGLSQASDGLFPVAFGRTTPENEHLARAALPLVAGARSWLAGGGGDDQDLSWAKRLVGLGPGLTPSGDDLLGGLMIALCRLGQTPQADALRRCIEPVLAERTNAISAALLRAAANGNGSLALHAVLESLIEGRNTVSAVNRLARQGHSSGTDALAGILLVLEAEQMRMEPVD